MPHGQVPPMRQDSARATLIFPDFVNLSRFPPLLPRGILG
jgi:hypothetical protein